MTDRTLKLRCLAFATLALFCALKLPAQQNKLDEQKRIPMESSVARFMASGSVPGVSGAVVERENMYGRKGSAWPIWKTSYPPRPKPFTAGIDFEIIDRNCSNAALGTGKTGSGRAEILSCLSREALADYQ